MELLLVLLKVLLEVLHDSFVGVAFVASQRLLHLVRVVLDLKSGRSKLCCASNSWGRQFESNQSSHNFKTIFNTDNILRTEPKVIVLQTPNYKLWCTWLQVRKTWGQVVVRTRNVIEAPQGINTALDTNIYPLFKIGPFIITFSCQSISSNLHSDGALHHWKLLSSPLSHLKCPSWEFFSSAVWS